MNSLTCDIHGEAQCDIVDVQLLSGRQLEHVINNLVQDLHHIRKAVPARTPQPLAALLEILSALLLA